MPIIETQGVSEDYSIATGSFECIERGNVSKSDLIEILHKVAKLTAPEGDACPPSVNTEFSSGFFTCFYGESGTINCSDSLVGYMSPEEASKIIAGEQTIQEYDALKGRLPEKGNGMVFFAGIIIIIVIGFLVMGIS